MAFAVAEERGLAQREALVALGPAEKVGLSSQSCWEPLASVQGTWPGDPPSGLFLSRWLLPASRLEGKQYMDN